MAHARLLAADRVAVGCGLPGVVIGNWVFDPKDVHLGSCACRGRLPRAFPKILAMHMMAVLRSDRRPGPATSPCWARLLAVLPLVIVACTSSPPNPTPAASTPTPPASQGAAVGERWVPAVFEVPAGFTSTTTPSTGICAPCHPADQTQPQSLAARGGLKVSGGYVMPGPRAAVWSSVDGLRWTRAAGLQAGDGSLVEDVAATGQRFAAVGSEGRNAAVWSSVDGAQWRPVPGSAAALADAHMTTVVAFGTGFVAAGYASTENGTRAVFWRSGEGLQWERLPGERAPGWVKGIAARPSGLVAVGTSGERDRGPAAVWTSSNGSTWRRSPGLPQFKDGVMNAAAAYGEEWFVVGHDDGDQHAVVWRSSDGRDWSRLTSETFGERGGRVEMRDIAASSDRLAAVGLRAFGDYDTATVWLSTDGTRWSRAADDASFQGGGMSGALAEQGRLFAVGSTGWPDNFSGTVWVSPPPP